MTGAKQKWRAALSRVIVPVMLLGSIGWASPQAVIYAAPDIAVGQGAAIANGDGGDAPDSTNHGGLPNTAYPGVPAKFPTVWEVSAPDASGPYHLDTTKAWLGNSVSSEADADKMPDADGGTNILNGGADIANEDKGDDGWLNVDSAIFNDCRESVLKVRLGGAANATVPITDPVNFVKKPMFLNAWFDGNRDGDWADSKRCLDKEGRPQGIAFEWVVQNWTVFPISGTYDIPVPTVLVMNDAADKPTWVRFTLSEKPATLPSPQTEPLAATISPTATLTNLPDGRGPQSPNAYELGETEDYLKPGQIITGTPGTLTLTKRYESDGEIKLGSVFSYVIELANIGGTANAYAVLNDVLPNEVVLAGVPKVTEVISTVSPLVAYVNPSGPSGTVGWAGSLSPNAKLRLVIAVKLRYCPKEGVTNTAKASRFDKDERGDVRQELSSSVSFSVANCNVPPVPQVELIKRVLGDFRPLPSNFPFSITLPLTDDVDSPLGAEHAVFQLVLRYPGIDVAQTAVISDPMPSGVIATGVAASRGVAEIADNGKLVLWKGEIGRPGRGEVVILIRARIERPVVCEEAVSNVAYWFMRDGNGGEVGGKSNPAPFGLRCADLGDAPDSSNHFGARMAAYPGVEAKYPTVFDGAAGQPRGPKHLNPRWFHLGREVSYENEADTGSDNDGVNNIKPLVNLSNLDRADDGLVRPLGLQHCQVGKINVVVNVNIPISTVADLKLLAFLNVWLDGNRDGDWADAFDCGANVKSREHLVVDRPIDVAALGGGSHTISVTTDGPAYWPDELKTKAAWLRVTLSERPSNKVIDTKWGDGRGYDEPFKYGETEDYLVRLASLAEGADPAVRKKGWLRPAVRADDQPGITISETRWIAEWAVDYRNLGDTTATNVHVLDTPQGDQTVLKVRSVPSVPYTTTAGTLDFSVGDLSPGRGGVILIRSVLPGSTLPGTVITNLVTIKSDNDITDTNNSQVVTLTVPLLPPLITHPTPGTTCTGTVTISGRAQAGVSVDVIVDEAISGTVTADSNGKWALAVTLGEGAHKVQAVAKFNAAPSGGVSSRKSQAVKIIVDSSLTWDPISLRFVSEEGRILIPRGPDGRTDANGWGVWLIQSTTYTVSVRICCSDVNAVVTLQVPGVGEVSLTDPDGDHIYSAAFTTGDLTRLDDRKLKLCVTCDLVKRCTDGTYLIDPFGVVRDRLGNLLNDADVACYQSPEGEANAPVGYALWPAASFGQTNPQTTKGDGYFSFFTPAGTYQLNVTRNGYQPYRSTEIVVADKPVRYDVALSPVINAAAKYVVTIGENGFEPAVLAVPAGSVVEFVNADTGAHSTVSVSANGVGNAVDAANAWDSGLLNSGDGYKAQFNSNGTFTYYDTQNPTNGGSIVVGGASGGNVAVYLPLIRK